MAECCPAGDFGFTCVEAAGIGSGTGSLDEVAEDGWQELGSRAVGALVPLGERLADQRVGVLFAGEDFNLDGEAVDGCSRIAVAEYLADDGLSSG